ncbi:MAG: M20/M25/M40 family metallo-hydrolase [Nitrospiraceae bacterium]|nr:M20/M25/M40 family metallo-hydrolase [Nitrospiraceae bacterium]
MISSTRSLSLPLVVVTLLEIILMLLPLGAQGFAQLEENQRAWLRALDSLSSERMLADVRTLSGPAFNGRQAGSEDDLRSAQWFARELTLAGLRLPLVYNGSLTFPFASTRKEAPVGVMASMVSTSLIEPDPVIRTGTADQFVIAQLSTDYLPVFDSPSADLQGQIVFVGYGIVDPTQGIDDYAGVDVNNCIVLFLRGKPDHYPRPVSHADKVHFARDRGALAYLTATGPILNPYETRRGVTGRPSAFYGQLPPDQALPGAWISTDLAEILLVGSGEGSDADRLRTIQEQLNKAPSARSRRAKQSASLYWKTTIQDGLLINVVGLIPGTGPDTIVIGAHRDHFGRPAGLWFPGADDNASGTAVMLEVARALVKSGLRPKRTILFVSFSGEEKDLLGSRLYTSRPPFPLSSTKVMINIDHAGVGSGRLTVGVTGLEKNVAMEVGQTAGCADKLDVFGFFPGGDHVPFKEAGVPTVTIVSSGVHPHFHQPTDTADTINPEILQTVARYVLALIWQLANVQ